MARRYEFYFLVAKTIFYSLAALVRKILFCHSKINRVISSIYVIVGLIRTLCAKRRAECIWTNHCIVVNYFRHCFSDTETFLNLMKAQEFLQFLSRTETLKGSLEIEP